MSNNNFNVDATYYATTQGLDVVTMDQYNSVCAQYNIVVATPAVKTFVPANVNATTNVITIAANGFASGLKAALTSDTTLPGGTSATNYWINVVSSSTIKLYDSAANALAGGVTGLIDLTDGGVGIHTLTPAAITGGVIKLQESIDGSNWYDIATMTANVTATAVGVFQATSKMSMVRFHLTLTTGQVSLASKFFTKEY